MAAKLVLQLSDEILAALRANRTLTIRLDAPKKRGARTAGEGFAGAPEPRAGSLPARVIAWAKTRKKPFGTPDIVKRFRLSRAHASMLLSRLAKGPYPIARRSRGLYTHTG